MANSKVEEYLKASRDAVEQVKTLLEKKDEWTSADQEAYDRFCRVAEDSTKKATNLQNILKAEMALVEEERMLNLEKEQREQKSAQTSPKEFRSGGDFMVALYNLVKKSHRDPRLDALSIENVKALSGEEGLKGGILIPAAQQTQILEVAGEKSFVRQYATVVPMESRIVNWPALDYSRGAAGVNAFSGGIRGYWPEENNAPTESQPYFKGVTLHARELEALCYVPNSLLRDSAVSLQTFFSGQQGFGGTFANEIDYKAINGVGNGSPLGVLNSPAKLTVSRSASTTFKFVDAVTMLSKMLTTGSARWVINRSVMPQLLQFVDAGNNSLFMANAAIAPEGTLLGLPVDWTGKNPVLGTAGDVMLIDWSYYLLGERQGMTMEVDTSYKFAESQTAYKATMAVDGQPWLHSVITLMDGTTTVSPYVVLS